jgi:hypothetical protein
LDAHERAVHASSPSTANGVQAEHPSSILCPLGCGQHVPVTELDSHEQAHRVSTQLSLPSLSEPFLSASMYALLPCFMQLADQARAQSNGTVDDEELARRLQQVCCWGVGVGLTC